MIEEEQDPFAKEEDAPLEGPAYLVTWGDMMTLLLTFFVLLVSMSTIQESAFHSAKGSIQKALSGMVGSFGGIMVGQGHLISFEQPLHKFTPPESQTREDDWLQIKKNFSEKKQFKELFQDIDFDISEQEVRVKLPGSLLFDPGRSELKKSARKYIESILAILNLMPGDIRICGYTDKQKVDDERFESNLLLSGYRAAAVVRALIDDYGFDKTRLGAFGYGSTSPIAPNDTPEGRAKNRRVEIVVNKPGFENMKRLLQAVQEKKNKDA